MNFLQKHLEKLVERLVLPLPAAPAPESLISKAARFAACEMLEGDYLEFGVYQGQSFIAAYKAMQTQFEKRIAQNTGGGDEAEAQQKRLQIWKNMRFFAFDSFAGLPRLTAEDAHSLDFKEGQYAFPVERFQQRIQKHGVPPERPRFVSGWFQDTCNELTRSQHQLTKAAVVWIDCDLYSSTKTALDFITPLLQDGTIIIFDDWFSYRGNPGAGEQRAFTEWLATISREYTAQEYQKEAWKRCSFIISRKLNLSNPA